MPKAKEGNVMKRVICLSFALLLCFSLIGCRENSHEGEAKTPAGSSDMEGRNYEDVVTIFEGKGFTNIKTEPIDDLIFGWLTKDGEVEEVSVGGKVDYSPDKWVPADIEVVVRYHTFPEGDKKETESSETTTVTGMPSGKIKMPKNTSDYIASEWTVDTLIRHFEDLGFTKIRTVACDPDDDRFNLNIFEMTIATGLFSDDPWEAGEEFDPDAEITIYYNEYPLLTIENCPDLVTVLTSKDMSYTSFCTKYDGRYIEFDAYVVGHLTYDGGTSHVISVTGGDYDGKTDEPSNYKGLVIHIGNRTWGSNIDESVQVGDNVKVRGRINLSWAEYYKCLYVETMKLSRR